MRTAAASRISDAPDSAPRRRLTAEDVPLAERDNPFVRYLLNMTPEQEDAMARLAEAAHQHGEDLDGSLDDIKAGRHVLQYDGRDADAWHKHEAELAAIRAKLGR